MILCPVFQGKLRVTIHYIDDGEDTGNILAQQAFPIPLGMRLAELASLSQERGGGLMVEVLEKMASGTIVATRQPEKSPTVRAGNLSTAEMWQRIDWDTWPVERIFHCLRYLEPRLHELDALTLPRFYRWEVAEFSASRDIKIKEDKGTRMISGKTGSILLRKHTVFKFIREKFYSQTKVG